MWDITSFRRSIRLAIAGTALTIAAAAAQTIPPLPKLPQLSTTPKVTKVDQPIVKFLAGMGTAVTLYGSNLEQITDARISFSGKAVTNWKISRGVAGSDSLAFRIKSPTSAIAGEYKLEVESNGAWTPTATFTVLRRLPWTSRPSAKPAAVPSSAALSTDRRTLELRKAASSRYIDSLRAARLSTSIKTDAKGDIVPEVGRREGPKDLDTLKLMGLSDIAFMPQRVGALGGLFNVTGKGLSNVEAIKLGGRPLELITRTDTSIVARFPPGVETIDGALSLVRGTQVGILVARYRAVDQWASFQPKIDARMIPHAPSQLPFDQPDGPYIGGTYFLDFTLSEVPGTQVRVSPLEGFKRVDPDQSYTVDIDYNQNARQMLGRVYGTNILLAVDASDPTNNLSKHFEIAVPVQPRQRQTYAIENTWDLTPYWGWEKTESWGVTSGVSETPFGKVNVGKLEVDGDLAFRIASGPAGTSVTWRSKLTELQNGWTVESMEWVESVTYPERDKPKARALSADKNEANSLKSPTDDSATYNQFWDSFWDNISPSTYNSDMVLLRPYNKSESNDYIWRRLMIGFDLSGYDPSDPMENATLASFSPSTRDLLRSMFVRMEAEKTGWNDHRVTVRLKRVVLKGPPNSDWRAAFGNSYSQEGELTYVFPPRVLH